MEYKEKDTFPFNFKSLPNRGFISPQIVTSCMQILLNIVKDHLVI
jgi:hypothetical protein